MADNFMSRAEIHDKIAVPHVQKMLKEYGLLGIPYGVEVHDKRLQQALLLLGRNDDTAMRTRFKPDLYIVSGSDDLLVNPKVRPIMCEVKCENRGHINFSIEFDSYCSGKMWDAGKKNVMYVFVRLVGKDPTELKCCWLDEVYVTHVNVPGRFDFEKNMRELRDKHPKISFRPSEHKNGAGTPFFIVPGDSKRLRTFESFMKTTFDFQKLPKEDEPKEDESTPIQLSF